MGKTVYDGVLTFQSEPLKVSKVAVVRNEKSITSDVVGGVLQPSRPSVILFLVSTLTSVGASCTLEKNDLFQIIIETKRCF